MNDLLAVLLGVGALVILVAALASMGYYIGKLPYGWVAAVTVTLACAALAISNVSDFLFIAPLLSSILAPAAVGFAFGLAKRNHRSFSTY